MSEEAPRTPEQVVAQARQHLESLRAAGVEWLPNAPPPAVAMTSRQDVPVEASSPPASFFTGPAGPALPFADSGGQAVLSVEERRQALQMLAQKVSSCPRCAELVSTRTQTVFGVGRSDTELCFLGEAPGADEDRQGEPFVGPAGQLLNRIIAACGMMREEVYICNILKCRPPGNRTPLAHEAANCREYLEKQLELIRPRFICALGACAAQNLLNSTLSIGRMRGRFHDYQGIPVLCTYHPSYLLRAPENKRYVWEDLKKLLARMGRPVPGS